MQKRASEWWMVELFLKGCLEKAAQKAADAATAAGAAGRQWGGIWMQHPSGHLVFNQSKFKIMQVQLFTGSCGD